MVYPVNLNGLNAGGATSAELADRIGKSMLSQNAGVQRLNAALALDKTRLSGLGQLQSALSDFRALAQSVAGVGLQTAATASKPSVLTAFTRDTAQPGTYQVDVQQLAQAQHLTTRPQPRQDSALGSGAQTTIRVEFGATSGNSFAPRSAKTITIDSSNNSLKGIADALKAAGLDAQVRKIGNGYAMELVGETGKANSMRISVGGDPELQKLLSYNPGGTKNLTETSAAQDAVLVVDGKRVTSAGNVILDQVPGTALGLTGVGATQVVVARESAAIGKNVANFVQGFNNLSARLKTLKQGDLKADPALAQVQQQLTQLVERNAAALAKVGVTAGKDGALQVNDQVLKAAVAADPEAVASLFTGGGKGIADKLAGQIGQLIAANGAIGKQKGALDRDITTLTSQKSALTQALGAQASSLASQYTQPGKGGTGTLFDFLA